MNAFELFSDVETGCVVEVTAARNSFYSDERGLTVHQSFFVYPDDSIFVVDYVDGSYHIDRVTGENKAIFEAMYLRDAA